MQKLSEAMREGLALMAQKDKPQMAYPTDGTGKALARRGLVEFVEKRGGWNYYRITDAGRAALEDDRA